MEFTRLADRERPARKGRRGLAELVAGREDYRHRIGTTAKSAGACLL
jgi:hypothetical protein